MEIAFIGTKGIPARYGGFETVVEKVSFALAKKGHKCIVYSTGNKIKTKIKNLKVVKIPQTGFPSLDRVIREFFPLIFQLRKPDVIFQIYGPYLFMPILKLLRRKNVLSTDGLEWKRFSYSYLIRKIVYFGYKLGVKFAQTVTTDSKFTQKWFYKNWQRRAFYIPYGPRPNKKKSKDRDKTLKKYNLEKNNYYLFVGRLVPEKGVHVLIKAFTQVNTSRKLVILGADPMVGSPYKKRLLKMANENVIFLGAIYGGEYKDICEACYANMRPSINNAEGIGPVTIEALGFSNCIIASDVPQNIEALGEAGIFFLKGDVNSLKKKIKYIEENYNIVQLYRKKATERAKLFSWKEIVDKIENIYQRL